VILVRARLAVGNNQLVLCGYGHNTCNQELARLAYDGTDDKGQSQLRLILNSVFTDVDGQGVIGVSRRRNNSMRARDGLGLGNRRPPPGIARVKSLADDTELSIIPGKVPQGHTLAFYGMRLPVAVRCPKHKREIVNMLYSSELRVNDAGFRVD
jgi:hypothetical protein